ncbi:zinc finger, c3HC4 type (RING finger) domain-containing protein [Phthorimaea operculella]|nr:zinc finger, c3HC4 type (RING finger) domain-containing protein [Phthorimaea operculella]
MLEESRMDKKSSNRSSQTQSRASAIDCKKSTESTHKPWPRNNKKREGPGNAPKNEPYRKRGAPAAGGRGQVDRRPRARGGPASSFMGGAQNTRLEDDDDEPEIGSVFVPGSKKQNLNHLLNFMYPSRGGQDRGPERRGAIPRRAVQKVPHRLEHDLYLRANCQFVVREDGDYKANLLDPDVPIKWEQVEEVVVRSTGRSECPICLGTPAAGRVGQCGHVYCWACALHYAHAHDKQPPPCPVCAAPLHVDDMRPTISVQWGPPPEHVTMRLVRRLRGSITVEAAETRGAANDAQPAQILPLDMIKHAPYTKFFTINKQQVRDILERERKEIQDQIMAEIDTTEIVFLEQALQMLKTKEEMLNTEYDPPKPVMEEIKAPPIVYEKQEINQNRIDWFDMTDDNPNVETIQEQVEELVVALAQSNLNPDAVEFVGDLNDNQPEEFPLIECPVEEPAEVKDDNAVTDVDKLNQAKYFYFYQAEDGQQVFLNSVNVRILNASWGALAAAPAVIKGRVLHRETLSLAEQMRKHMPYTAHLPLYCSFDIVELDLQPPYVTDAALKNFAEELDPSHGVPPRPDFSSELIFPAPQSYSPPTEYLPTPVEETGMLSYTCERAARRAMEPPPRPDFSSELIFPAPQSYSPPTEYLPPPIVEETGILSYTCERAARRAMEPPPRPDFSSELIFPAPQSYSPPTEYLPPPIVEETGILSYTCERAARRAMEPPPRPDFSSELIFPAPQSYSPPTEYLPPPVLVEETESVAATPSSSGTSIPASPTGLSFAKMASTSGTWRVRKTAAPPPPPPDPEEEGAAPRALSLSDAIEAALLAKPAGNSKKKKHKQKLLFATGVQRDGQ